MTPEASTFGPSESVEPDARLHLQLATFNRTRLAPRLPYRDQQERALAVQLERAAMLVEQIFVERERGQIARWAASAPTEPDAFVRWFERLKEDGPGQGDPLFPWLAQQACRDEMRWFLQQEAAGEAGFDDLVALTQIKLDARPKLELARNYWDEMGCGHTGGMHGPMLQSLCDHFDLDPDGEVVWQSRALGNLMVALACNREYAFQSIGALGVIELTAPGRAAMVNAGLQRLGVPGQARRYFALHATLDVKHSAAWNAEVLAPIVAERPECAHAIAEGALMRLRAGERCFERYRLELGVS